MIIGRSDSWQDAVFLLGASTPTGRLAAGCGSHLGQRSSTASKGRTHGALSTRFHHARPLQPGGRPHTEKRRSTEPRNTVTIGVTATADSTSDWREEGAQVTGDQDQYMLPGRGGKGVTERLHPSSEI